MVNPEKSANVPVPASESAHNAQTVTTEQPPTAGTPAMPAPESSAPEVTRSPEDQAITPATAPPTYEDTQKEAVTAPAVAVTNGEDQIEATRTAPTYPSYDEKVAMNAEVPINTQVQPDPRLTPLEKLHEDPKLISCPFCNQNAMTRVNMESTSSTSMAAVCCCLFGGIICAFLPYCMQMCHDSHHFCTSCGQKVAYAPHDAPVQVFGPLNPGSVVVPPAPVKAPEAVAKN